MAADGRSRLAVKIREEQDTVNQENQKKGFFSCLVSALLFHSFVFSLVLNYPTLVEQIKFSGRSPEVFSDWDEPFYLAGAYRHAQIPLSTLFVFEQGMPNYYREAQTSIPHSAADLLLGKLSTGLGLKLTTLAVLLDLICAALAFYMFSRFFVLFAKNRLAAEMSSLCLLYYPWLLSPSQYLHIPLPWFPDLLTIAHQGHFCQPVIRGPYTQLSYPILALMLYYLGKALTRGGGYRLSYILAGLLAGTLVYAYFYAWGTALALTGVAILLASILAEQPNLPKYFGRLVHDELLFFLPAVLVSLPALKLFLAMHSGISAAAAAQPALPYTLFYPWYFSVENFIFLLAVLALLWKIKQITDSGLFLLITAACLISELVLMNGEVLFGAPPYPYHFALLYLDPLITGCLTAICFSFLVSPAVRVSAACVLMAGCLAFSAVRTEQKAARSTETALVAELTAAIEQFTEKDYPLVMIPYTAPFKNSDVIIGVRTRPYQIAAITNRPVFLDIVSGFNTSLIERELLVGWLYTGQKQFVGPCLGPNEGAIKTLEHNVFTYSERSRRLACQEYDLAIERKSPCDLLEQSGIRYLIWEKEFGLRKPDWYSDAVKLLWQSKNGEFELLEITDKAKDACKNEP
jgi:hypothetical protein